MEGTRATGRVSTTAPKPPRLTRARRTAILKALADPRRYELLELIARSKSPLSCAQANTAMKIAPATLSHHIRELETAGLIEVTPEGRFHFLKLRAGVLESLAETLQALDAASCASH